MVLYGKAPKKIDNIKKCDESVVYLGQLEYHFGHFLVESLARLWFLLDNPSKKVCYLSCEKDHPYLEFFYLFGLAKEQMIWVGDGEVTQFAEVIVPEPSFRHCDYFHKEYKLTCDRIREGASGAYNYKKVYFSRRGDKQASATFGEEPIERTFVRNGYKVFHPEKLSMPQKLKILANCEYFAGTSGTGMHNVLWCKDGITCYNLNRSLAIMPVQVMIDKMKGLHTEYIDAYLDILPTGDAAYPFILGLNPKLRQFFDERGFTYRLEDFRDEFGRAMYYFLRSLSPAIKKSGFTFKTGGKPCPFKYGLEPMQDTLSFTEVAQKGYDAMSEYDFTIKPSVPCRLAKFLSKCGRSIFKKMCAFLRRCVRFLFACVCFPFRCVKKVYRKGKSFLKRFKCIRNIYYPLKTLIKG